jgi:Cof subfamily protein (haloacid dehalogenase superfamily)
VAVRLIASDLDGTLFGEDHLPAPRTVAAVNAARDAGIHMVAATGRSWFRGAALATSTGARLHHFIGSNGGHRVDLATGKLDERLSFSDDAVRSLVSSLSAGLGPVGFGYELEGGLVWDDRFVEFSPINITGAAREVTAPPVGQLTEVGKMFVIHPDVERVDLVELVDPMVPSEVNVTTSGAVFVELTPAGADKGAALARLAAELGIDRTEAVAFGDNQNDLSMLTWAGRGIAMENALDLVKAIADETTTTNEDHGVARVIEAILHE